VSADWFTTSAVARADRPEVEEKPLPVFRDAKTSRSLSG
jgi:hypothetical protein